MGRPAELADGPDPIEREAGVGEGPGITPEGRGVAADISDTANVDPASALTCSAARPAADRG